MSQAQITNKNKHSRDEQLHRHHHQDPTLQMNDKEPLATVPATKREGHPRTMGDSFNKDSQHQTFDKERKRFPAGEGPPQATQDIPSNTAEFPPSMEDVAGGKSDGLDDAFNDPGTSGLQRAPKHDPGMQARTSHQEACFPAPTAAPCCDDDDDIL